MNLQHKQLILEKVKIHYALAHPCIVRLYAAIGDENYVYHLMEYLPGGDLFEMLSTVGALPEQMAKRYAAQLILAVDFLHSRQILHNDIKPENLLIDSVETIKLTDFGMASFQYQTEEKIPGKPSIINGTPQYMAPETILKRIHGRGTDWWSVGICIYEMLTGSLPFDITDSDSTIIIFKKILRSNLVIPDYIDSLAADLINRLLCMNPEQRLGKCGAVEVREHKWFSGTDWNSIWKSNKNVDFVRKLELEQE